MVPRIRELNSYIGLIPFGVLIDDSSELKRLVESARKVRSLSFEKRLQNVKGLALESMENAYEGIESHPDMERRNVLQSIVYESHPLSYALKQRAGCCRYQGVLFFILGFESNLGSRHILQSAQVSGSLHTVFNDVFDDAGKLYRVNIFTESLKNKSNDYSTINPRIYDCIDTHMSGVLFYSYYRRGKDLVIVEGLDTHGEPTRLI